VFPFHTLASALLLVDPRFVSSGNAMQKGDTFLIIPAQKAATNVTVRPILFRVLIRKQSNFMQVKSVVDDFLGGTLTNAQST
jgi:hypothetical protein